jgi:hypothetical protein
MRFLFAAVMLSLSLSTPAAANRLIAANVAVPVAKSDLQVTPTIDWNKLNARPGRNSETWTQDGELLNDLSFYGGIEDGKTLFREVNKRNRPLPRFSETMLLTDIPMLLESSYRIARDVSIFSIDSTEPAKVAGRDGVHFTYSFVSPDELRRNGEAHAVIANGRLYMATFEAPTLYYFENYVGVYRQVAASLRIAK